MAKKKSYSKSKLEMFKKNIESKLQKISDDMNDLKDARTRLDKILFKQAEKEFSNFKDIYNRGF